MSLNLDDYFKTVFEEKLSIRMPERGPHVSGATRLLELRREQSEVERALSSTKEEFHMKRESLQQRQEELQRKEAQLKTSLLKFDRFLKENDAKRERAGRKAQQERELCHRKRAEAEALRERLAELRRDGESVRESVRRVRPAHDFLERVLHVSTEFPDARALLSRHATLLSSRRELAARGASCEGAAARLRLEGRLGAREAREAAHLGLGGQLARLRAHLEQARARCVAAEAQWTQVQNTAAKKTLLLGQLRVATFNLYQLVGSQLAGRATLPVGDTERQLTQIQMFVEDLGGIVNELRRGDGAGH